MKSMIFIGSSTERIEVAEAVEVNLSRFADVNPWKHTARPGNPLLADIVAASKTSDYAVIVLTPDDILHSKDKQYNVPRDNVIFELGLFVGSLGSKRVFAIVDETIDTKILTDYAGITVLTYNGRRADKDMRLAVSPACVQIKAVVMQDGPRDDSPTVVSLGSRLPEIGIDAIYDNFSLAEPRLLDELRRTSGPVRLFFQIASQSINAKGTLFDSLNELVERTDVEIRVLHAAMDSPLFSRDRLSSLGKNPDTILRSLRHVDESLRHLEAVANSSLRRRTHDYPFIWRMYGLSNTLYLMPYFSEKDAAQQSPVIVFGKKPRSLYHTFTDWFDYAWNKSSANSVILDSIITPATPCGTALLLEWEGFHVFGIPKRDIIEGSEYVRFYGLGGKREDPHELLETCAIREGNEESGGAIATLRSSPATDFFRSDGVIERIELESSEPRPRLLYEKREHTGLGSMKPDDDYYYMIGFEADLAKRPLPSREIAALLFINDRHLEILSRRNDVTIGQLMAAGARVTEQPGFKVKPSKRLVPHGTASYLVRQRTR